MKDSLNAFSRNPMRAQSKPFVVEIKSSRRTDRSKPKSLWGDLDLSVAEEAITDEMPPVAGPELFRGDGSTS
ncbi:hypothetical protein QTL95_26680 [Rhizobium sp. S152]|uniref:hypothetical protein n=1 Tax=Rhizobium sp. S152 TaxID=3055038 RepID=UPI0025A9DBF9|nr:hypothetical protein [Rhizobium sp. S152]MDM9629475.1 hypothetical protein [Rhizobium sp. S152]